MAFVIPTTNAELLAGDVVFVPHKYGNITVERDGLCYPNWRFVSRPGVYPEPYVEVTNQQIFDKVATHLLTQQARASDAKDNCRYRQDGLKCAVGCLIPDDRYSADIEGGSVNTLAARGRLDEVLGFEVGKTLYLLRALQHVHDDIAVSSWKSELILLAKLFDLNTDAIGGSCE